MLLTFIIVYLVLFSFLLTTVYAKKYKKYYTFAKLLNSLGFIAVATYGGVTFDNMNSYLSMLPALVLCLCGDVLLGLDTQYDKSYYFIGGVLSFAIAHISFIFYYNRIAPLNIYDFILPVVFVFVTYFMTKLENMEVPEKLKKIILVYSFFVTLLLSKSIGIMFSVGIDKNSLILFIGSLFFFVSDLILMFLYFYKKKFVLCSAFNLLFYYSGMFLLAYSIWL